MMVAEMNHARDALYCIPPDLPRDDWVKVAMAAQSAGLDFETFNDWSAKAGCYEPIAVRDVWKSIKPGKGIGPGTLFRMAGAHGWRANSQEARQSPQKPQRPRPPGMSPAEVWRRGQPATYAHPYIVDKAATGAPLDLLRVVPEGDPLVIAGESMAGALIVPCLHQDGTLSSAQIIAPPETAERLKVKGKPSKLNLPGASLVGCHVVGNLEPAGVVYVCEGIGQAWACWQATGRAAAVAFGWGRVRSVAEFLRQQDPTLRLVLVPDVGKEQDANKISAEVGAAVACMPEGWPQNSDVNDLARKQGADVLAELLEAVKEPSPPSPPFAVLDLMDQSEPVPPEFVWEGYIPKNLVTILSAHGGTGKSTLAIMLAVAVCAGLPLFNLSTKRGRVAFFSGEDGAELLRYRLRLVCRCLDVDLADISDQLHIIDATEHDPVLYTELTASGRRDGATTATYQGLRQYMAQHEISLLIVDNASDAFDANEIDRARVRAFMRALALLAHENDAAVLLLAHVDKGTSRGDRSVNSESYSGSTAWHNSARSRLFMSRDKDGTLLLEHQKCNVGPMHQPLRLYWPHGEVPKLDEAFGPVVQGISDRGHTKTLLKLIAEFTRRGEYVTTATTARTHAAKLLRQEPSYPKLKDGEVFDLLRRAERAGHLERVTFMDAWRKPRERWQVTPPGEAFAGIHAATAATSHVTEADAQAATAAATAATSPPGGVGESAPHKVTENQNKGDAPWV